MTPDHWLRALAKIYWVIFTLGNRHGYQTRITSLSYSMKSHQVKHRSKRKNKNENIGLERSSENLNQSKRLILTPALIYQ